MLKVQAVVAECAAYLEYVAGYIINKVCVAFVLLYEDLVGL